MLYYSKKSRRKLVHFDTCGYAKRIGYKNFGYFETIAEAIKNGYRLCPHCNPALKMYRKEKQEAINYCAENGLICYPKADAIEIKTPHSTWRVAPIDDDRTALFHRNTRFLSSNAKDRIPGFHYQKVLESSIRKYCDYILAHDCYRINNPLQGRKKAKQSNRASRSQKRKQAIAHVMYLFDQLEANRLYGSPIVG